MAIVLNEKKDFETLASISSAYGCKRQIILNGSCPLLSNPHITYSDRVLLDLRIGLIAKEEALSLEELKQKFHKLLLIQYPEGQTELLTSQFNGKKFLLFLYHVYSFDRGINLYNSLKEEYFDVK